MILRLIHAGDAGRGPLGAATATYHKRLSRRFRVEERWVKASGRRERGRRLAEEGERLIAAVGPRDHLVALDRGGQAWSSEELSARLAAWMQRGFAAVCFALGSASGLAPLVVARAAERWSFGPLTLPHDLARVVLWEQLYRASSILSGEPYHK